VKTRRTPRAALTAARYCGRDVVGDAERRNRLLGTREFYLSGTEMLCLLRSTFGLAPGAVFSLNRPQAGGGALVHRVEWRGLVFTSVSRRPFVLAC
jgi:hypothetical protein